jgi:hypothetical protein
MIILKIRSKHIFYVISAFFLLTMSQIAVADDSSDEENFRTRYLKVNIHAQRHSHDAKASYANWTNPGRGHFIVRVNTPIRFGERSFRRGFTITDLNTNTKILFEYNASNMGMSNEEYMDIIAGGEPIDLSTFSSADQKGIQEGSAYRGMTKKGVIIALGYPAAHRTPSLDDHLWVYWKNRFRTMAVEFDNDDIVVRTR